MLDHPLLVKRRLGDGSVQVVGQLAENSGGCYFQYDAHYLAHHSSSLAPFNLKTNTLLQKAPRQPNYGLHGVFADSLPDGWGLYLMDRVFRNNGYNPRNVTALERLAFIGNGGLGALFYEPTLAAGRLASQDQINLVSLGQSAVKEFEGTESHLIEHLMNAGGSGGARPKLAITKLADGSFSTRAEASGQKLIIKLTSNQFHLQHNESLVEFVYMTMARRLGIEVADFGLVDAGDGHQWLQQTRFDCVGEHGRQHMISAAGLLDADFRTPSLDYVDLIKATRVMCGIEEARKLLFRALFNYLTVNQDDHAKNFSFLADDQDRWRLSPLYDIVYSPAQSGQHMTAFNGAGVYPNQKSMAMMAGQAGLAGGKAVLDMAEQIYEVVKSFSAEALQVHIPKTLANEIQAEMDQRWLKIRS